MTLLLWVTLGFVSAALILADSTESLEDSEHRSATITSMFILGGLLGGIAFAFIAYMTIMANINLAYAAYCRYRLRKGPEWVREVWLTLREEDMTEISKEYPERRRGLQIAFFDIRMYRALKAFVKTLDRHGISAQDVKEVAIKFAAAARENKS